MDESRQFALVLVPGAAVNGLVPSGSDRESQFEQVGLILGLTLFPAEFLYNQRDATCLDYSPMVSLTAKILN